MREIKFRAWVVDEYTEDGNNPKTFKMIPWNQTFFSDQSPVTRWGDIFPEPDDPFVFLMQFTGLKDKNGREIYEGDIVDFGMQNKGKVLWSNEACGFVVSLPYGGFRPTSASAVIGNIYENPDLVTGGTK